MFLFQNVLIIRPNSTYIVSKAGFDPLDHSFGQSLRFGYTSPEALPFVADLGADATRQLGSGGGVINVDLEFQEKCKLILSENFVKTQLVIDM